MTDREPWRCPACKAWIRPDVEAHWCEPDGGVTARRPDAPLGPFTSTSVTTTFPAGMAFASGGGGGSAVGNPYIVGERGPELATVTATIDGRELFRVIQAETLRYETRNRRRPDAA
jgi:hypothetical protein